MSRLSILWRGRSLTGDDRAALKPSLPELAWHPAQSADDGHDDLEADLDTVALGSPGGACWAWVTQASDGWSWVIYSRWLWEDIDADPDETTLAEGKAGSQDAAKAAVAEWVRTAGQA